MGTFNASSTDGVVQLINGNAGKSPVGSPAAGGFTGWSLIGINPDAEASPLTERRWEEAAPWIKVAFTPHVDALEVAAPESLAVGEEATITATVIQDGRRVPVAHPVGSTWSASERATLEATTGRFVATAPGRYTVTVVVNATEAEAVITVA